jgi:hypothetical protein
LYFPGERTFVTVLIVKTGAEQPLSPSINHHALDLTTSTSWTSRVNCTLTSQMVENLGCSYQSSFPIIRWNRSCKSDLSRSSTKISDMGNRSSVQPCIRKRHTCMHELTSMADGSDRASKQIAPLHRFGTSEGFPYVTSVYAFRPPPTRCGCGKITTSSMVTYSHVQVHRISTWNFELCVYPENRDLARKVKFGMFEKGVPFQLVMIGLWVGRQIKWQDILVMTNPARSQLQGPIHNRT